MIKLSIIPSNINLITANILIIKFVGIVSRLLLGLYYWKFVYCFVVDSVD